MTVAERVKKAIAEYYRIDAAEVADDRVLNDHMLIVFITIKLGIPSNGTVGQEQTVAQLIAMFEEHAKLQDPGTYEESPRINSVRDAVVVATAKHKGIKPEEITDDTAVEFAGWEDRGAFSDHLFRLLGFGVTLDYQDNKTTVRKLTEMFEDLRESARHGI